MQIYGFTYYCKHIGIVYTFHWKLIKFARLCLSIYKFTKCVKLEVTCVIVTKYVNILNYYYYLLTYFSGNHFPEEVVTSQRINANFLLFAILFHDWNRKFLKNSSNEVTVICESMFLYLRIVAVMQKIKSSAKTNKDSKSEK